MKENKFIYNLKDFEYFKKNIRLTCTSDTLKRALTGMTATALGLWIILTVLDIIFGIYKGKLYALLGNWKTPLIFSGLILFFVIVISILSLYSKKALDVKYHEIHSLYLSNPVVLKRRKISGRKRNVLCVIAELPKEQEYLEKRLMKLFYENKKAEKTVYSFLAVSHGKKETLKQERFKNQIISCDETLENYFFSFERFRNDNEEDDFAYYMIINGHNIRINNDRAVMAEIILFR